MIWTDESTIELGKCAGHQFVMRLPGEEHLPECIQLTFPSGCQSLMVWGVIAHGCKAPLIRLDMLLEQEVEVGENKKRRG